MKIAHLLKCKLKKYISKDNVYNKLMFKNINIIQYLLMKDTLYCKILEGIEIEKI